MVRNRLGRGLSALLGEKLDATQPAVELQVDETVSEAVAASPVHEAAVESIVSNPFQPRLDMDPESLEELSSSIRQHGLLEPLLVRPLASTPGGYQLIAGERRLIASKQAGLTMVPVVVHEVSDQEMLEIAIVENVQRENLNPIDEARAYRLLMDGLGRNLPGMTQQEVADRVGKSRAVVANLLRLLDLPDYVQESIQHGNLSQGHGKVLAGLEEELCRKAWQHAVDQAASVRELEKFVNDSRPAPAAKPKSPTKPNKPSKPKTEGDGEQDPYWKSIEDSIQERLRTKVSVRRSVNNSGVIEVHFFNLEDLDRLLETLSIEL